MSRVSVIALALGLAASSLSLAASAATAPSPAITAAVADSNRPQADKDRDADRKPAEMLAFAEVKPGDKVVDFMPGAGYFTRLFAKAVGPKGRVYSLLPGELATRSQKAVDGQKALAQDKAYGNIVPLIQAVNAPSIPEKVDVVWTSQNYHDLHDAFLGPADVAAFNKAIFSALKPGGVYIVLDHAGETGSGLRDTDTLHRIDPETVKKEVEAAGFVFDGQDDALHNTADNHTLKVFDPALRGHTDQFVFRFRKPK
ncbi:methyltransferase [Nitrospirillum sp. BR 11164]|uniref:class I SAM-dependent methyltransferase n=1 Tax=Nitrospirillum sp. BR 11164 TaxID=3104324 RepID=UPI002AFF8F5D|nr:methyltransferase [Nitrospirillum sp. BR 11164]MEA1650446.1 methyltransferase [Nitrospirillum sp. BR 11164]